MCGSLVDDVLGFVSHVTRYVDERIEVEFFDFEKDKIAKFSNDKERMP
jgi:hypothetical protein